MSDEKKKDTLDLKEVEDSKIKSPLKNSNRDITDYYRADDDTVVDSSVRDYKEMKNATNIAKSFIPEKEPKKQENNQENNIKENNKEDIPEKNSNDVVNGPNEDIKEPIIPNNEESHQPIEESTPLNEQNQNNIVQGDEKNKAPLQDKKETEQNNQLLSPQEEDLKDQLHENKVLGENIGNDTPISPPSHYGEEKKKEKPGNRDKEKRENKKTDGNHNPSVTDSTPQDTLKANTPNNNQDNFQRKKEVPKQGNKNPIPNEKNDKHFPKKDQGNFSGFPNNNEKAFPDSRKKAIDNGKDTLKKPLKNAVNMGSDAAKKAKSIRRVATSAASGNMAKTAIEAVRALKDNVDTKKISAFVLLVFFFLTSVTTVFTYALPSSQYEVSETYTKEYYKEKYESAVYGSTGDVRWARFIEGIKINAEKATDKLKIGSSLKKLFIHSANIDHDNKDIEEFTDDGMELKVSQVAAAQKKTLENKIEATQKKIYAREKDIDKSISKNEKAISNSIKAHYKNTGEYDDIEVNFRVTKYALSDEGAAAIMALYMVQDAGSLYDIKLSSLMKWLGYYDSRYNDKVSFDVLGTRCKVNGWNGTFLPQYLHEQKKEEQKRYKKPKTDFSQYQAAAADLILKVDVPKMEEINITKSVRYKTTVDSEGNETTEEEIIGIAEVDIKIQPRELSEIADMMGFWIGSLTNDQATAISQLSVNMISSAGAGMNGLGIGGEYNFVEGGELIPWRAAHNLYSDFVGMKGQCTWYAADRLYQLYRDTNGKYGADLTGLMMGNGGEWSRYARSYGYKVDRVAAAGKAACFVPGQTQYHAGDPWVISQEYGHIAIVEKVNPDGSIVVSEFWGSVVDYTPHVSTFTAATAAQIDYIDFTKKG